MEARAVLMPGTALSRAVIALVVSRVVSNEFAFFDPVIRLVHFSAHNNQRHTNKKYRKKLLIMTYPLSSTTTTTTSSIAFELRIDKMSNELPLADRASTTSSNSSVASVIEDDDAAEFFGEKMSRARQDNAAACDACPNCDDACDNLACEHCYAKRNNNIAETASKFGVQQQQQRFTMCQIRRHNHAESAWLVAGDTVYDATRYLAVHPGGRESILRRAGGVKDCTMDIQFHGKRGQQAWKNCIIGKVKQCGCDDAAMDCRPWKLFWFQ